jgi:N-acylneuraminate cytidylyltransferase
MKNLAVIPARGGSKRIPRKNIKDFLGKPIIAYSIEVALKSELFDEIMVSTDDNEIAEIAKQYGANIPFYRSESGSNDFTGLADVIIEVINDYKLIKNIGFDYVCCILPTAPFVTSAELISSFKIIEKKNIDCVFPVVMYSYPIQRSLYIKEQKVFMNWPENLNKRSQDLTAMYHDAGQYYIIGSDNIQNKRTFFVENSYPIIKSELEVQDVDTELDWKLAELKYRLIYEKTQS